MAATYYWRAAGTTGRAHLVMRIEGTPLGKVSADLARIVTYPASMSECGMVRGAAWVPPGRAVKCGLCRRLERLRRVR